MKNTNRALFSSVVALILCCSMLVGSTFAWFTDEVKSGVNQIVAGNLDIVLEYSTDGGNTWADAEGKTLNFVAADNRTEILWEPGCTYKLPAIRVRNNGNLALQYEIVINGVTGNAKLLEAIEFTANGNPLDTFSGHLDTNGAVSESIEIQGHMKEEAGNEYQGLTIDGIGITVYATQYTYEKDSFDETYDAIVRSADELIAALTAGQNVKLGGDIDLAGIEWNPIASYSGTFDGVGYTISNLTVNSTGADVGMFASLRGATIKNLKLENVNVATTGNRAGAVAGQIAKEPTDPGTVIENVTVSGAVSGNYYVGGIVGADRSYNTLIKNCVNTAAVTGGQQVGGIVGQANRLTVIDTCSNSGKIEATNIIAGGIVGLIAGDDKGGNTHLNVTVQNSTNTGAVSDSVGNLVGGIAGAIGRDGGDPIVDTIVACLVKCTVADGQKLYGAKYNYCSGEDEQIVVIVDDSGEYAYSDGVVYACTTEQLQAAIDKATVGTTIRLVPGVAYGAIELGRPTKHNDTQMYCETHNYTTTNAADFVAHLAESGYHTTPRYTTTLKNVTVVGAKGATVAGLIATSGHMYGDVYDYVRDKDYDTGSAYYLTLNMENVLFSNVSFAGKIDINTSDANSVYDGITFDKCSFTTGGTASANGAAIRYYNESNNGNVKNIVVNECTFNNCYQGIYVHHVNGISVTGCTFDTTGHNAIAIQSTNSPVALKNVAIIGNTFSNIGDRVIRFGMIGADSNITIQNNVATNSGDEDGEVMKAVSIESGIKTDIKGNTWNGTVVDNQLKDA